MNPKRIYRVGREGTVIGSFNEPELVYLVSCSKVLQGDDCWTDGMPSWSKVASIPELRPQAKMNPRLFPIWWKAVLAVYLSGSITLNLFTLNYSIREEFIKDYSTISVVRGFAPDALIIQSKMVVIAPILGTFISVMVYAFRKILYKMRS
jgi:hypothetical protein